MYRTWRLAQLPQRPSSLWNLRDQGYSEAACLDFDFSVLDWGDRFQAYRDQQKKTTIPGSQRLMNNQAWVPKYDGDGDILARVYGVGPDADKVQLDPVLVGVSADDLWADIEGWQA